MTAPSNIQRQHRPLTAPPATPIASDAGTPLLKRSTRSGRCSRIAKAEEARRDPGDLADLKLSVRGDRRASHGPLLDSMHRLPAESVIGVGASTRPSAVDAGGRHARPTLLFTCSPRVGALAIVLSIIVAAAERRRVRNRLRRSLRSPSPWRRALRRRRRRPPRPRRPHRRRRRPIWRDRPRGRVPARWRRGHHPGDQRRCLGVRPDGRAAGRSCDQHVHHLPLTVGGGGISVNGAIGFDSIWVSDFDLGQVRRYDTTTAELGATVETRTPEGVLATEDGVWIANHRYGMVSRIDPGTDEIAVQIEVAPEGGSGPKWTHRSRRRCVGRDPEPRRTHRRRPRQGRAHGEIEPELPERPCGGCPRTGAGSTSADAPGEGHGAHGLREAGERGPGVSARSADRAGHDR